MQYYNIAKEEPHFFRTPKCRCILECLVQLVKVVDKQIGQWPRVQRQCGKGHFGSHEAHHGA